MALRLSKHCLHVNSQHTGASKQPSEMFQTAESLLQKCFFPRVWNVFRECCCLKNKKNMGYFLFVYIKRNANKEAVSTWSLPCVGISVDEEDLV